MEGRRGSGGTDFMRYVFMGLAVVLVILLAVIMVNVYRSSMREDVNIVIIDETETETEAGSESEPESGTEVSEETETPAETEASEETETPAETEASETTETLAETATSETTETSEAAEAAETVQTPETVPATEAAETVQTPETVPATEAPEAAAAEEAEQEPNIVIENTEPTEDNSYYVTISSTCNFRSTAGYTDANGNDSTMWELPGGTVVELLQDNGGWAMIRVDGTVGYVGSKFLAY